MIQWPAHSKIVCVDSDGEIIASSKRSRLDLADSVAPTYWNDMPFSCGLMVSTKAEGWTTWNASNVSKIEDYIRHDLGFDGYTVKIRRVSKPGKSLCTTPFIWNLEINAALDANEPEICPTKKRAGSRFKVARMDASVGTIQSSIEKVFGLPRGCVCLLTNKGEKANSRASIKHLRNKWKNG